MLSIESNKASSTQVLVAGHGAEALARFGEALAELDRPFAIRAVSGLDELRAAVSAGNGQCVVVVNDRMEHIRLPDVIALCSAESAGVPLVVVSERSADDALETIAHSLIKAGVRDYVYMDRLYRLYWALQRELVRMDQRREILRVEGRFAGLLDIAPDAVVAVDAGHRVFLFNRAAEEMFGFDSREVLGQPVEMLMPRRFARGHRAKVADFSAGTAMAREMGERGLITARRRDGSEFLAEASISVMREQDGPVFVAMLRDVTQKRLAAERIAFLATHDSLTGLLNRGALNERLQHAIDCAERDSRTVALMFIDLDGFKGVNDSFGHAAGDSLLCAIAGRFIACARKSDTVSRIGGDEFAVVLHDPDSMEGILHFADKMLACAREPVSLKGDSVSVSASIGISIASLDRKSAEDLMIEADVAMYQAKSAGKNRVALFSGADGERHARRSQDLRGAAGRFTGAAIQSF